MNISFNNKNLNVFLICLAKVNPLNKQGSIYAFLQIYLSLPNFKNIFIFQYAIEMNKKCQTENRDIKIRQLRTNNVEFINNYSLNLIFPTK